MDKRKTPPSWAAFPEGALLSLTVYIGLQCLLALLVVKAAVPEGAVFRCQLFTGAMASFGGCAFAVRRCRGSMGPLPAALLTMAAFAALVLAGAVVLYGSVNWSGGAIPLLISMAAGGCVSALAGAGKKGKRQKKKAPAVRRKAGKRAA